MPDPAPPPPPLERKKQIVAAKNILFGTGYFLILSMPQGWKITRSYLEPDIHSVVMRDPITWVEAGQTDWIVFHPQRRIALDFMIRIKRGEHDSLDLKGVKVSSQGQVTAGGHPASYYFGEIKEGVFKKKTRKTLRVCFYCPELRHTIFLHFTGTCQDDDLREIFDSLAGIECH